MIVNEKEIAVALIIFVSMSGGDSLAGAIRHLNDEFCDDARLRDYIGRTTRHGRLEVQFESFAEVSEGFFFRLALTCDVDFEALRDVPVAFLPNGGGEGALHGLYCFTGRTGFSSTSLSVG